MPTPRAADVMDRLSLLLYVAALAAWVAWTLPIMGAVQGGEAAFIGALVAGAGAGWLLCGSARMLASRSLLGEADPDRVATAVAAAGRWDALAVALSDPAGGMAGLAAGQWLVAALPATSVARAAVVMFQFYCLCILLQMLPFHYQRTRRHPRVPSRGREVADALRR